MMSQGSIWKWTGANKVWNSLLFQNSDEQGEREWAGEKHPLTMTAGYIVGGAKQPITTVLPPELGDEGSAELKVPLCCQVRRALIWKSPTFF